jgi:hypothetical protein
MTFTAKRSNCRPWSRNQTRVLALERSVSPRPKMREPIVFLMGVLPTKRYKSVSQTNKLLCPRTLELQDLINNSTKRAPLVRVIRVRAIQLAIVKDSSRLEFNRTMDFVNLIRHRNRVSDRESLPLGGNCKPLVNN